MPDKTKVIFIMGYGHSGSTLLDIILGNHGNIASSGELVYFNPLLPGTDKLCACGQSHKRCSYWRQVSGWFKQLSPEENPSIFSRHKKKYDDWRSVFCWWRLIRGRSVPSSDYRRYQRNLRHLLKAVARTNRRPAIVDSSKSPCRAASLSALSAGIDLRIIHLVRDGRAVGWSMIKKRRLLNGGRLSASRQMMVFIRAASGWALVNLLAELAGSRLAADRYLRLRYEDLFEDQNGAFTRIARFIGEPMGEPYRAISSGRHLHVGHLAAGNDMRMQKSVFLNPDFQWRQKLPPDCQLFFRLFGKKALKHYGYPI